MHLLRCLARMTAYAIALLLSAVWAAGALAALRQPLFDLGRPRIGQALMAFAGTLSLSPQMTLRLAHLLMGFKLLLAAYLFGVVILALWNRLRFAAGGDALLDLGLFVSAVASIVAAFPVASGGQPLQALIGELMLAAIASGLTAFARGGWVPQRPYLLHAIGRVTLAIRSAPWTARPLSPPPA